MRFWKLIALAGLATACASMSGSPQKGPPPTPEGGHDLGSGMILMDKSAAKAECVKDPDWPGGFKMTLRWLYWRVYVKETGNKNILASQTCTHKCVGAEHTHSVDCRIGAGGCSKDCPYKSHNVDLEATTSTEVSKTISRAVSVAEETVGTVSAEIGVEAGPVKAGVSGSVSKGKTETKSIEQSVTTAVSQSITGSVQIELDHFNTGCCSDETWWFGTREYEVRLILQVVEQDYSCESWSTGLGKAGVLPGKKLKAEGYARYIQPVHDVQLGTYQVPSNEPLDTRVTVACKCKPKAVTTPPGGGKSDPPKGDLPGDQGSLPTGTSKFVVTPGPRERVFVHNPTPEPLYVNYAEIRVLVDPGGSLEIPREVEDEDEKNPKGAQTANGSLETEAGGFIAGFVVDWEGKAQRVESKPGRWYKGKTAPKIEVEGHPYDINAGGLRVTAPAAPGPEMAEPMPDAPRSSLISDVKVGGISTNKVYLVGAGRTQTVQVSGLFPEGTSFALSDGIKKVAAHPLATIQDLTGQTRSEYLQFANVPSMKDPRLVAMDEKGREIAWTPLTLIQAEITTSISPRDGRAGSQATLAVDCSAVLAALTMEGLGSAEDFDLVLDFSRSGGATGPATAPLNSQGKAVVKVKRGSQRGAFEVMVGLKPKAMPEARGSRGW